MSFLDVGKNVRWLLALTEQVFVSVKNLLDYTIGRSLVDLCVTAGLVNNYESALPQVFVNVIRVIRRRAWRVSVFDSANLPRAVRIGEQLKNFSEVVVGPRSAAAGLDVSSNRTGQTLNCVILNEVPEELNHTEQFHPNLDSALLNIVAQFAYALRRLCLGRFALQSTGLG